MKRYWLIPGLLLCCFSILLSEYAIAQSGNLTVQESASFSANGGTVTCTYLIQNPCGIQCSTCFDQNGQNIYNDCNGCHNLDPENPLSTFERRSHPSLENVTEQVIE